MFEKKKSQLHEIRIEIESLGRTLDAKNDEIKRLKDQIREMQTEADSAVTNEDIAQAMRNKIANALKNLRLGSAITSYYNVWAEAPSNSISDIERMIVAYLAFINNTRSA